MTTAAATLIRFRVHGTPVAQPRPRAAARIIRSGPPSTWRAVLHWHAWTRTARGPVHPIVAWRHRVQFYARAHRPDVPLEGPLRCDIAFLLRRPQRLMRASDPDGLVWCPRRPDRDNLDKAVLDALEADRWFRDGDAQVVDGVVRKYYHEKTGRPGAIIRIGPAS